MTLQLSRVEILNEYLNKGMMRKGSLGLSCTVKENHTICSKSEIHLRNERVMT